MLIDLYTVAHCEIFFKYILQISNLQFIDLSDPMADNLPVFKNEAINLHFEESGYEYSDSILSMGSVIVTIVVAPLLVAMILAMRYLCCCQRMRDFFKRQLDLTLFNRTINFLDTQLLIVTTCAWINIYQVDRQVIEKSLSYDVSIGSLAMSGACIIALFTFLFVKLRQLNSQ